MARVALFCFGARRVLRRSLRFLVLAVWLLHPRSCRALLPRRTLLLSCAGCNRVMVIGCQYCGPVARYRVYVGPKFADVLCLRCKRRGGARCLRHADGFGFTAVQYVRVLFFLRLFFRVPVRRLVGGFGDGVDGD